MTGGLEPHALHAYRLEGPARLRVYWTQMADEGTIERVDLAGSGDELRVTVLLREDPDHPGAKTHAGLHACDVPLEQELGSRVVVDGCTGAVVRRTGEQRDRGWDSEYLKLETPREARQPT